MSDTQFFVGPEPVIVDAELSDYPEITIGEEATFEFWLRGDTTLDIETGATYGAATGGAFGGAEGFSYGTSQDYRTADERYNRLKEYLKLAQFASVGGTLGDIHFTETRDFSSDPVDTLLLGIEPGRDVTDARGVWGVLRGGDDATIIADSQIRITMTLFVLAEYDDYEDEAAVRSAFETSL